MFGVKAKADPLRPLIVQTSELRDAKWFTRHETEEMVRRSGQVRSSGVRVPGSYAIAHHLIKQFTKREHFMRRKNLDKLALGCAIGTLFYIIVFLIEKK